MEQPVCGRGHDGASGAAASIAAGPGSVSLSLVQLSSPLRNSDGRHKLLHGDNWVMQRRLGCVRTTYKRGLAAFSALRSHPDLTRSQKRELTQCRPCDSEDAASTRRVDHDALSCVGSPQLRGVQRSPRCGDRTEALRTPATRLDSLARSDHAKCDPRSYTKHT